MQKSSMSNKSLEKLQVSEELRVEFGINIDKRELDNLTNDTEVVYKPTTMVNDNNQNQKFQSLKPESYVKPNDSLFLYRTVFIACLVSSAAGIGFSWTSPVIPKLRGPDTPLNAAIDATQESKIASILSIGAAIGPFLFGYLADKIGRKYTLIIIALPMVAGMGMVAFTDKVEMYYLARLLYGMGSGGVFTVLIMYIGEITEDHNRGKFCGTMGVFLTLGLLYPLSIGPMLSIKIFCLSCLLPLQLFLIFFYIYCPETPIYLAKIGKNIQAERVLIDLRNKSKDEIQRELSNMQEIVESQKYEKGGVAELFRTKSTRQAFMVAAGLLIIQQVSGINAVTGYLENIFLDTGTAIPTQVATTLIGVIQVLTVLVSASLIEKLGRKFLLLSSVFGSAVSIIILGLYFFLHKHQFTILVYFWWLPIICLIVYIISFNLGLASVPWTIVSEIFPNNVKSSASALVSSICFGVSFLVTLAFPIISEILSMGETFWIFGVCCVLGLVFIHYLVPETKGKTLAEIQDILSH